MPQTKNRISSASQKQRKSAEETVGETDSPEVLSPAHKSKQKGPPEVKDGQTTIGKHLKPTENFKNDNIEETLKNVSEKLNKLASQAFIESQLKEMVTEEFLSTKLKELEKEEKCQVKKELENVNKQVNDLKDRVTKAERSMFDLRNTVVDMEITMENMQTKTAHIVEENKRMREQLQESEIKLTVQSEQINNLEQYTRRNTVRLYGLEDQNKDETSMETAKRVAKLVNEKLNVKISTADIDIAHRMGRFSTDQLFVSLCLVSQNTMSLRREDI
ncbi:uncharacterized protein LOC123565406 [Mercenaria mercenaria]|uniref:uncharacterized protein LOC123565406 n=1 Tax=Mercenaria mercenaria TaxID=6596 RepID=UPI00234F63C8|nr:uncharacterized protein LOC123565406 [Mercenaria mercenaria]